MGVEGFLCAPGSPCPPYFNDVWRTQDGSNWELVQEDAPWPSRPGHQVVLADTNFVLFGGFGLDTLNPFNPANPIDTWVSSDGENWEQLNYPPWNAVSPEEIKYDFDALTSFDPDSNRTYIYSFGGDRETFNFFDPTNHLNIDNDVWRFYVTLPSNNILEHNDEFNVQIWPNPTNDFVKIVSEFSIVEISLYNIFGEKVFEQTINQFLLSYRLDGLSRLPTGVYLLKIQSEKGTVTRKLKIE